MDTGGRVARFERRFGKKPAADSPEKADSPAKAEK